MKRKLINTIKCTSISLVAFFSLNGCEPVVEEELVPDYSAVKASIVQMPYVWEEYMRRGNYDAAVDLTYPYSDFWRYTGNGRFYDFEDMKVDLLWFKPERGTLKVDGTFWNEREDEYTGCTIGLKKIEGADAADPNSWKLCTFVPYYK